MENINFIPATELPVAEGEEVSVLCVENGEMNVVVIIRIVNARIKILLGNAGKNEVFGDYGSVLFVVTRCGHKREREKRVC